MDCGALAEPRQLKEVPGAIVLASERQILDPLHTADADDLPKSRQVRLDWRVWTQPASINSQVGAWPERLTMIGCSDAQRHGGLVMKMTPLSIER